MPVRYVSTRGGTEPMGFRDAVMTGLAPDGGLLLPDRIPDVGSVLGELKTLSYTELAFEIMRRFTDVAAPDLRTLVDRSYRVFRHPSITPVVPVGDLHILELFHGPTLAFKDVALQFLGNVFEFVLAERGGELNVVGATSGDTGSAAIQGVRGKAGIRIFILYPDGKVSPVQERQMTSVLDENVFNLAIAGSFDDCQRILKSIFGDVAFKQERSLGSVNSINWARVLAQVVYYFYAYFRVAPDGGGVSVAVPTGNFGDIFAGYVAARMGLPLSRLILATNENDILARFFRTGLYRRGVVQPTISPSMDIQVASNFERYLYYHVGSDPDEVVRLMRAFSTDGEISLARPGAGPPDPLFVAESADTAATLATIKRYHERYGYLLDPHSAVGVTVGERCRRAGEPLICLATAHAGKFGQAVRAAVGRDVAHHELLDGLADLPTRFTRLPADESAVRAFLESNLA